MMNFLLGIFTGISIAILWGMYLNKQREKKGVPKNQNPPPPPGSVGIYIDGKRIATTNPYTFTGLFEKDFGDPPYPVTVVTSIEQPIQEAVERDDFEEAARLRDLINTKK